MLYVSQNGWDFLHPREPGCRTQGQCPWAGFQRPLQPSPASAPLAWTQNCWWVSHAATSWMHQGKPLRAFCRGFCARVVGSLMLKNVYFYLYLLVQCKISIWSPISIWGALWSSHPFTIALGMALARPVLEFSIHQLIYSAKYIMNMQSWLCTSVSF